MALYNISNGAMQTSTTFVAVTTGTVLKTLQQIRPSSNFSCSIVEWGISFDGSAAATPGKVELVEVDVAATVTAYVASDLMKVDSDSLQGSTDPTSNLFLCSTIQSGYTATAEGSITTLRNLAPPQFVAPTTQFIQQFPLGQEPVIRPSQYARIRVFFGTAVNAICYMKVRI